MTPTSSPTSLHSSHARIADVSHPSISAPGSHHPQFQPIPAPTSQTHPAIYGLLPLSRPFRDPSTAGPRPPSPALRRLSSSSSPLESTGIFPIARITIALGSKRTRSSLLPLSHRLRVLLLWEHPSEELGRTYAFPPPQPPTDPLSTARLIHPDPLGQTHPHHLIPITSALQKLRTPARDAIQCYIVNCTPLPPAT